MCKICKNDVAYLDHMLYWSEQLEKVMEIFRINDKTIYFSWFKMTTINTTASFKRQKIGADLIDVFYCFMYMDKLEKTQYKYEHRLLTYNETMTLLSQGVMLSQLPSCLYIGFL